MSQIFSTRCPFETYTCTLLVTAAMSTKLALKAFFLPFFFFFAKNAAVSAIFAPSLWCLDLA